MLDFTNGTGCEKRGKGEGGVWQMLFSAITTCHRSASLRSLYFGPNPQQSPALADDITTCPPPLNFHSTLSFYLGAAYPSRETEGEMGDWEDWPFLLDEMYTSVVKINNCCCVQARFLGKEIYLLVPCYKTDICLRSALCISSFELIFFYV